MITMHLPFPPSVNTYWRHVVMGNSARTLISAKGRAYKTSVAHACARSDAAGARLTGRLSVTVRINPPDKRKRDLDNLSKALLDSLTDAGVWLDDSQIDRLVLERGDIVRDGGVTVTVEEC